MLDERGFDPVSRRIIGAFYDVYNTLRFGFLEQVYAGALAVELQERDIAYQREGAIDVRYKDRIVGFYRADFIVERSVVVEVKAGRALDPSSRWQTLNYLRATGMSVGLVLHFGPTAQFQRVVGPRRGNR